MQSLFSMRLMTKTAAAPGRPVMADSCRYRHRWFFRVLTVLACCSCQSSRGASGEEPAPGRAATMFTVTHFAVADFPFECQPQDPDVNPQFGVAVTEDSAFFPGECRDDTSSGRNIPDCQASPVFAVSCGRTVMLRWHGMSVAGFVSGVCPQNHWNNAAKGAQNPCLRGAAHVDLADPLYGALGLTDAESFGSTTEARIDAESADAVDFRQ